MSKRPSDQAVKSGRARKVKTNDAKDDTLPASDGDSSVTSDSKVGSADRDISLEAQIMIKIFGDRPAKHETRAAEYIANILRSPSPAPSLEEFLDFLLETHPTTASSCAKKSWNTIKEYFSEKNKDLTDIQGLINVDSLRAAFAAPPQIVDVPTAGLPEISATSSPLNRNRACNSSNSGSGGNNNNDNNNSSQISNSTSRADRRSNSGGSNTSTGNSSNSNSSRASTASGGQLSAAVIAKMQTLFKRNYDGFVGDAWILPSGVTLDKLLASHVETLPYESSLHSFVVGDIKEVMQLIRDKSDREFLQAALVDRPEEQLPALSEPEKAFLLKYNIPPDDLKSLLSTKGWRTIGGDLDTKPDEEFQEAVHTCVQYLLTTYQQVGMEVPRDSAESWYIHILWHFLSVLMSSPRRLEYQPGEVHSRASAHRRNKIRTREGRQQLGHKADGMGITKLSRFELCAIEAARKDNGPNATKAFDGTRKLAKMTKDMHDHVREAATENIRYELLTFGIRISALKITLYTLRQRPGRFYQLCTESSASLPDMWTEDNTMAVLGVLERLLVLRKAMLDMSRQIPRWVSLSVGGGNPGAHNDCQAATLTTPYLIPDTESSTAEIPELALP
ncbi:hypothetical protein BGX34_011752 [Mortierella sp. NVP85]|nr:hypothetical protein BGX34_011752 [Mortierella sp. NVP85]